MVVDRWDEDAADDSSSHEAGAIIGQYRLLGLLGEGAIGRVYLAEHLELGRRVALKMLRSEFAKKTSVVERFFGEARAVNQIHHENIVEITDFVRADEHGRSYYIMELLEGQTLKQLLDEIKVIPNDRALAIAKQICSALEAVHAKGIVHRDLKPENIFLSQKGGAEFVKLLDFGAAKLSRLHDEKLRGRSQTLAGVLVGTPRYMAPEQTYGAEVDHRADIYALGVLLHEMVSGDTPFGGENTTDILLKHRNEEPPPPPKHTPETVAELIRRCLLKNPEQRPQSMSEVCAVLVGGCAPKRSPARAMTIGTMFLLLAGGFVAYFLEVPASLPFAVPAPPAPPTEPARAHINVTFRSTPNGASVLVSGAHVGVTPLTAQLARSTELVTYELRLDGYRSLTDGVRPTDDSTVTVVLTQIPKPERSRTISKRIKRKRAPRVRPRGQVEATDSKKEIGLGDMRDPFSDK